MTAAARRRQRRQRSLLVVHIHILGGEATRAALTLLRVVFQGSSRTVISHPVLRRVIKRADTSSHIQQPVKSYDIAI